MKRAIVFTLSLLVLASACSDPKSSSTRHLKRANLYYENRKFEEARIELLNALKKDPSSAEAYRLMGDILFEMGNAGGSAAAYRSALELSQDDLHSVRQLAKIFMAAGQPGEAESLLEKYTWRKEEDREVLELLSLARARLGKKEEAVALAREIIAANPSLARPWVNLAMVLLVAGDAPGAQEALGQASSMGGADEEVLLMRAAILERAGQYAEAASFLEELTGKNPDNVGYRLEHGMMLERARKPEEALTVYRKALEWKDDARVRNRLGLLNRNLGRHEEAKGQWEAALKLYPAFLEPRIHLAQLFLAENRTGEALPILEEALRRDPENPLALSMKGEILLNQGKAQEAVAVLQAAARSAPDNPQIGTLLAKAQLATGDPSAARSGLSKIVQTWQERASEAMVILARIEASGGSLSESSRLAMALSTDRRWGQDACWILGDNLQKQGLGLEAEAVYDRCRKRFGDHPGTRFRNAFSMEKRGELTGAADGYMKLLDERPSAQAPLSGLIRVLLRADRKNDLLEVLGDEGSSATPPQVMLKGAAYEQLGMLREAENLYLKLLDDHPEFIPTYGSLVSIYVRQRGIQDARSWLAERVANFKEEKGLSTLLILLGVLNDAAGEKAEAIRAYRLALEKRPDFPPSLNNLAWNLAEAGDLKEALRYSSRAVELAPEDPYIADTHAWILHRMRDSTAALQLLRKAVEKAPQQEQIRMHLVEVLKVLGREEEAERYRKGPQRQDE